MNEIKEGEMYGLHIQNKKKRKLKKGESDYPQYEFRTVSEIFDALTKENINRFFRDFKTGMSVSVHMRDLTVAIAKDLATKDGVELPELGKVIEMPSFTWIDD
jgi:hypothetical protein